MIKIKHEVEKIEIPNELHERSILGVRKAKLDHPKRRFKTSLVTATIISVIGFGILLSPIGYSVNRAKV